MNNERTVGELGEFSYLQDHLHPILGVPGELPSPADCAIASLPKGSRLVVTSDVGPRPISWKLRDGNNDFRTYGYYSVLVNASDLATEGCDPIGYLNSTEFPASTRIADIDDFFGGVKEGLQAFSLNNLGGNLREAATFATHGTAIGSIDCGAAGYGRGGAQPGDYVVAIGPCGQMITSFLKGARLNGITSLDESERRALLRPMAQVDIMRVAREKGVVFSSVSDNSDGVLGSLANIRDASKVKFELLLSEELLDDSIIREANVIGALPWNLFFFWGDWQIIATLNHKALQTLEQICSQFQNGSRLQRLGTVIDIKEFKDEQLGVAIWGKKRFSLIIKRNENFVARSFNRDAVSHVHDMLSESVLGDIV